MYIDFGFTDKKSIADLITINIENNTADLEFLTKEIVAWMNSTERKMQISGDDYYEYSQDIERKKREVITDAGLNEDPTLPNNKILDNQYAKMVDQKVNYILSKPITFKSDNQTYIDALDKIFNKRFHRLLKNVGKDSYNGGIGYIYPYYDEYGEFKFKRFKPYEIKVYWKDDDKTEIDFFIHYYKVKVYENKQEQIKRYIEVYDKGGIHKFEYTNGSLVAQYSTNHLEVNVNGNTIGLNWNRIPLIPFKSNSNAIPLIKKCKCLQDAINRILSEFNDGMQENASGNSIIIIKNYDGENLGEFRKNLSQYKAVKVRTVDGADGGIDKLEISVNCQNYMAILMELRKALIQNCKGYDVEQLKSSGSPNEMTIKSIYSDVDLDANELETEYQASFEDLLWFVNQHLANIGVGVFDNEKIDVIFNRDMMVNESQIIADLNASSAILSKKTLISMHPWIDDVDAELKAVEEEKKEAIEEYGSMMANMGHDEDVPG